MLPLWLACCSFAPPDEQVRRNDDAIAPVVSAESIDWEIVFKASRYDKGEDDAYGNCPL
ncbi:MAG: hypothetical protein HC927_13895, partial [Deltaproteobacteria bacterium]|nr:hypothetical protein [Deltaproteobacteria bacterium]